MTRTILLTGATGFVGGAVRPALLAAGWHVRCLTRSAAKAEASGWVQGDIGDPQSAAAALAGCDAALYLAHSIGEAGDYHARELQTARVFADAAAAQGVRRIVYLGGVAPVGKGSDHLRSRLEVGEVLRQGRVPTVELRASMIVGHGSLSWLIVRDLAARLPVMVLPRWLKSRTQPIAIDDVVAALVAALDIPISESVWFDVPGPAILSGRQILEETSRAMGLTAPYMVEVPFLTPRLSSLWVRLVTRAKWSVAREVVVGLTDDLLAADARFWSVIGHTKLSTFGAAAAQALAHEAGAVPGLWGMVERARGGLLA